MKNLTLNIIPFSHPFESKTFGFTTEKKEGYFPIHRAQLPSIIKDEHWEDFNEVKYLYSNFEDTDDQPYTAEVDFLAENKFVKHYYSQLIMDYFKDKAAAVNYNFVKDIEIWFIDKNQSTSL